MMSDKLIRHAPPPLRRGPTARPTRHGKSKMKIPSILHMISHWHDQPHLVGYSPPSQLAESNPIRSAKQPSTRFWLDLISAAPVELAWRSSLPSLRRLSWPSRGKAARLIWPLKFNYFPITSSRDWASNQSKWSCLNWRNKGLDPVRASMRS